MVIYCQLKVFGQSTYDKIAAIKEFRAPKNSEEVRSFLGLINYVGKFIPNLATKTEQLRQLIRDKVTFQWTTEHQKSFEILKQSLSDDLVLGYYDVECRTQVIADASPVGLGAVLIQFQSTGPRVISFANRSLTSTERNYAQTEKEALALVWAVERFHHFLFGRSFELVTDHKALEALFSPKSKPCARIERWVMRIMSYQFKVIYRPGKANIADPLSRLISPDYDCNENKSLSVLSNKAEEYIKWIVSFSEPKAIPIDQIEEESSNDEEILQVKRAMQEKNWQDKTKLFKPFEYELCFIGDILLRGSRIVIPQKLRERTLQLAHEGHPGMTVMKRRLRAKVWWPEIDKHTEEFVKKCRDCILVGIPNAPEPLKRTQLPSAPWQHLAIDFCGPLPSGHHLFVVVDYYSRFVEVEIFTKIDSTQTIKCLKKMFARFGLPLSITADNGPQFISEEFKQYCRTNNIHLINTTPYWPQQNGEVERQNRSLLKRLVISQNQKGNWQEDLQDYLLMYRSTPHSTTLRAPAELMFNRNIRDKLPILQSTSFADEEMRDRDAEMKFKGKEYADRKRHAKDSDVNEEDIVLAKRQHPGNKLATKYEPTPYKVVKRLGSEVTIENIDNKTVYKRNVAHIKKNSRFIYE